MDIKSVVYAIIPLFLTLLLGVFVRLCGIFDWKTAKKLASFLVNVTQPALIIASFQTDVTEDKLKVAFVILIASAVMHVVFSLLAALVFAKSEKTSKATLEFGLIFGNCAYLGYPVLKAVFGPSGLFYGAVFTLFFNVYIRIYGVYLLNKGKSNGNAFVKALVNPGTLASVVGILLFVFSVRLPDVVLDTVNMVGDLTFPLSMIVVGCLICNQPFKNNLSLQVMSFSIVKLLIVPLLTLVVLLILNVDKGLTYICVIMAAMPTASNTALFAEIYKGNSPLAASCVGFSSLLSVLTVPMMLWLTDGAMKLLGK